MWEYCAFEKKKEKEGIFGCICLFYAHFLGYFHYDENHEGYDYESYHCNQEISDAKQLTADS